MINSDLLISAAVLQDYFVDKTTGFPLAGGIVSCYQDNSRTTYKNWYYQSGTPDNYTYIPLPNPLTLSGSGTITDDNGNDTIPFFYPYSEDDNTTKQPYYITVDNSQGQRQFTRQNFPYAPNTSTASDNPTNKNLIVNNEFWRNVGSVTATNLTNSFTLNGSTFYYTTIAPSQHDGFSDMKDIQFIKDVNGSVDVLTFQTFVDNFDDQIIEDDITPEYYLNVQCTGIGSENFKYIQIPIQLHVYSLSGVVNCSAVIDAMSVTGSPQITVGIFQFLGTGVTSPETFTLQTIPLDNGWKKYVINFSMPSSQNVILGNGGDDALYLRIGLPVGSVFNLNIAKPAIYLSNEVPTNDFATYDEINAIISSYRTGQLKISLDEYEFGFVPMNDGTIGNSNSNASARASKDVWPLYNYIWNKFKPYNNGTTNPICQMLNSSFARVAYGSSAIADFNANNSLTLTAMMGKVILGTVPFNDLLSPTAFYPGYKGTFTASSFTGLVNGISVNNGLMLTTPSGINRFSGEPLVLTTTGTLPTGLSSNLIYYAVPMNFSQMLVATSFANTLTNSVVGYTDAGSGIHTIQLAPAGTSEGEYRHVQQETELAPHSHPGSTVSLGVGLFGSGSGHAYTEVSPSNKSLVTVASDGSGALFNVTQPGTFYNIFMKL